MSYSLYLVKKPEVPADKVYTVNEVNEKFELVYQTDSVKSQSGPSAAQKDLVPYLVKIHVERKQLDVAGILRDNDIELNNVRNMVVSPRGRFFRATYIDPKIDVEVGISLSGKQLEPYASQLEPVEWQATNMRTLCCWKNEQVAIAFEHMIESVRGIYLSDGYYAVTREMAEVVNQELRRKNFEGLIPMDIFDREEEGAVIYSER
jgi:hypothetical protein